MTPCQLYMLTSMCLKLLRLNARSGPGFMLSPTHEEEITTLVAGSLKSYKELPIRLYQISKQCALIMVLRETHFLIARKYRDERRPRGGLLRTREFLMKDLYTFDLDDKAALGTYHNVKDAYDGIFQELKIKYLVAEADSGSMGGSYSHEFHFATPVGEDNVISCNECSYVANEELAERRLSHASADAPVDVSTFISHDGFNLVKVHYGRIKDPKTGEIIGLNIHALKKALPSLDIDFGVEEPQGKWLSNQALLVMLAQGQSFTTTHVFDGTLPYQSQPLDGTMSPQSRATTTKILAHPQTGQPLDLTGISNGDNCPRCPTGQLSVQRAVELGHTFHLGTRYSEPLGAAVSMPGKEQKMALSMGCHGIGVTRMIAAVASILVDGKGLNWPRVIAPYEVVIVPRKGHEGDAEDVYDALIGAGRADAALDDRKLDFIWKLNDADRIGFPVVVVLGRAWKEQQKCEVQCRRLGNLKQEVALEDLPSFVAGLLSKL